MPDCEYLGRLRVPFHSLQFLSELDGHPVRPLDRERVKQLAQKFRLSRLQRDDPSHHLVAVTPSQDVTTHVQAILAANDDSIPFLQLEDGQTLQGLYGQHRIEAARSCLRAEDRWWAVCVYNHSKSL